MERYTVSGVELPTLIAEVDRLWERLESDPELRQDAEDAEIDVSRFTGMRRGELIEFRTHRHGIGGPELLDAAAISAVSGLHVIAWDLWKRVLLPRLVQRFGKRAVKRADTQPKPRSAAKSASAAKKSDATSKKGSPTRAATGERATSNSRTRKSAPRR